MGNSDVAHRILVNDAVDTELTSINCVKSSAEYENLIYAMYKSDDTPEKYKPHFEKVLFDLGEKKKATS